jgi:hypothetical protein
MEEGDRPKEAIMDGARRAVAYRIGFFKSGFMKVRHGKITCLDGASNT